MVDYGMRNTLGAGSDVMVMGPYRRGMFLVTGGAGFVGSHGIDPEVVRELSDELVSA